MSENMKLWDSVKETDPKRVKSFNRSGGFSGTAINPTYNTQKATALWGPIGGQWGFEIFKDAYINGAPLVVDGAIVGHEVIHVVGIQFKYPDGSFPVFGQTTFVGKNKYGFFTDEEAPKKSLTDAISKALSMLGFSADIHLGLYDDNKYVNDIKKKFEEESNKAEQETKKPFAAPHKPVDGAFEALSDDEKQRIRDIALDVIALVANKQDHAACKALDDAKLDADSKVALWSQLDSKVRSAIKKAANDKKMTEEPQL